MFYRKPSYYDEFKCIADKCPDTCCAGWNIVIDDRTMDRYRNLEKSKKEYVLSHIDLDEQIYVRDGSRCSFLDENNLCKLYSGLGENMFCNTCRRYPRHFEEYGNLIEAALSLSCPEAARLIVDRTEIDRYLVKTDEAKKSPHQNEVDRVLLANLLSVRKHIFDIMSDRSFDIYTRMYRTLIYGAKVQKLVYQYEKLGIRVKRKNTVAEFMLKIDMLIKKETLNATGRQGTLRSIRRDRKSLLDKYFDMLLGLENINERWPELVNDVRDTLYRGLNDEEYVSLASEFDSYMSDRMYEYEHIFNYFIYTYFLGGVYDYNIQAMVKFAVLSVIVIRELGMYRWLVDDKSFTVSSQLRICWMYSRQIEHSDDNLMALEGILNAHPMFSEDNIIKIF